MLDTRTLTIVLSSVFLISAIMIIFAYRQNKDMNGPREWAIGLSLFSCGMLLLFLRGSIPSFLSIFLANNLLIIGHIILYIGIATYLRQSPNYKLIGCVYTPYLLLFIGLYDNAEAINTRIHIVNVAHGIFFIAICSLLFKFFLKTKRSAYLLPACGFAFLGIDICLRSVTMLMSNEIVTNLMSDSPTTAIHFFFIALGQIIVTLGLLMLISERLQQNLAIALEAEQKARLEQNNFWGMVSHEFKTPLGTILNSVQLVENLEKNVQQPSKDALKRIQRATLRLSRLVDKSLVNEWTSATTDKMRQIEFSLSEILENLSFEYDVPFRNGTKGQDTTVSGDPFLLSTAISSLLDNALKYTNDRKSCYISLVPSEEGLLEIDVFNTGDEIPLRDQKRIFEKFYRAQQHNKITGSGFGLYIVKKIVDFHNAEIEIISDQTKTIFRLTIAQGKTG